MNIKTRLITGIAGIFLAVLSVGVLAFSRPVRDLPVQEAAVIPPLPAMAVQDSSLQPQYWLCELDGYVAVYDAEARHLPLEVTEIAVAGLRRVDQEMFRNGVLVAGGEDLVRFLEDFRP